MAKTSAVPFALLVGFMGALSIQTACSQNTRMAWSSANSGFGLQASNTSRVGSSAGEGIVGGSQLVNTEIESGFIAGLILRGLMATVPQPSAVIPVAFSLSQNYPNPFNPGTTIKFELPVASQVDLTVYDILGRKVKVLVDERKDAGAYEVKFDALEMASGVYFYRMQAGHFVQTRKLLLLR